MLSVNSAMMAENVISGRCGTAMTYALNEEGTLTLDGTGAMTDYDSENDTPWHSHANEIKNVIIKNGVTTISANAFTNCTALKTVNFINTTDTPSKIWSIGANAFMNCSSLESVEIPSSVYKMGESVFYMCSSLKDVVWSASVTTIPSNTFAYCTSLTAVKIPEGVTTINNMAFYQCSALNSLRIASSVKSIKANAFGFCYIRENKITDYSSSDLEQSGLTICDRSSEKDGLLYKGNEAVFCRKYATNVTIPNTLTSIRKETFKDCTSLKSVTMSENMATIGDNAFNGCTSLSAIVIPETMTTISNKAFYNCYMSKDSIDNQTKFNLENYGMTVCDFEQADGLLVKGEDAVYCRSFATSVNIPDYVSGIKASAFQNCEALAFVTIPTNVNSIEENTFSNCPLSNIEFHCACPAIEANAFANCDGINVVVPINAYEDFQALNEFGASYIYPSAGINFYTIPTLSEMENALASVDSNDLTAITFACELSNEDDIKSIIGKVNPNCVVYVKENSEFALSSNFVSVSANEKELSCENLLLTDNHSFQAPQLSVKEVTYTHNPSVWANGKTGWETICLPFSPNTIKADIRGYIAPIVLGGNGNFWLRKYVGSSSDAAFFTSTLDGIFEANTPYLIAFPGVSMGNGNLEGQTITFAASNVTVTSKDTDPIRKNSILFKGTYNSTADNIIGYELDDNGSTFEKTATPGTHPFRAYFYNEEEQDDASNVKALNINFGTYDETTGIFTVEESTQMNATATGCYDMNGRRINESDARKGVYVVEGKKVIKL